MCIELAYVGHHFVGSVEFYERAAVKDTGSRPFGNAGAVIVGGGSQFFKPVKDGGKRADGRDLVAELKEQGMMTVPAIPMPGSRQQGIPAPRLPGVLKESIKLDQDWLKIIVPLSGSDKV